MELLPDIDVRSDARIVRNQLDEIKAIQNLLADVYKDAGDGRTLFRELVQNADDAKARTLKLTVVEHGWPNAKNSLLHGPALLVTNDGAFSKTNDDALHEALGGSKEADVAKIGRFGIGLKSVFHLCEAFLYLGAKKSKWRAGVVNPWAGTGAEGENDPIYPEWNKLATTDSEQLRFVTTELLEMPNKCLLLWIPLRRREHLNRGSGGRQYGLGDHCPQPDDVCEWFARTAPAALLLAQCGHLQTIDVERAASPEALRDRETCMRVTRDAAKWVGRYRYRDAGFDERAFAGEIVANDHGWNVVGVESLGDDGLRRLRTQSDWPKSLERRNGRYSTVPQKALEHAAVTVLRPSYSDSEPAGTRMRWAAFLPLDDDPEPSPSSIVEIEGSSPAWEVILHGYFWPSQDRRSIPGVTEDVGDGGTDGDMRSRWNRALCDKMLLPLLPKALANAVTGVEERVAREFLDTVVNSDIVKNRSTSVSRSHWLLPVVADDGIEWKALSVGSRPVLSIPKWNHVPEKVRRRFVAYCDECSDDVVFIDEHAARIADGLNAWTDEYLKGLLASIPGTAFGSPEHLRWVGEAVRHAIYPVASESDSRAAILARWLVGQIRDGVLAYTTRPSVSRAWRDELREIWSDLCGALPMAWLLETLIDCQPALRELASDDAIGERLFPVPFGRRRRDWSSAPHLDQERLDDALIALGKRLEVGGESHRLRHSRLLLADALLARRDDRPMGKGLAGLPLLRVSRFPIEQEEAWTVDDLSRSVDARRVFAGPSWDASDNDRMDGNSIERPPNLKQAVAELGKALDDDVWLVSGNVVASLAADVPLPRPKALAIAVLQAETLGEPAARKPLLMRLAKQDLEKTHVRGAARVLLAGRPAAEIGDDAGLFHDRTESRRALYLLLRLLDRPWCVVAQALVERLPQETLDALSVRQADSRALHSLLSECLETPVNWTGLSDEEAATLLQHLHGTTDEEQEHWRRMPLHRGVDGTRRAFNRRTRRSTEKTNQLRLPPELEAEDFLLDPDLQVAHLYHTVPEMDRDGLLQLMLEDSRPWRFAEPIVQGVRVSGGPVLLPRNGEVRDLLRLRRWLPLREGGGIAPEAVIIAPKVLLDAVFHLVTAGALGDKRLSEAVNPKTWGIAEPVVREVLGRLNRQRQVQRMVDALDSQCVGQADGGTWLVMPHRDLVNARLIEDALQTTLTGLHPGWKLVHAAAQVVGRGGGTQSTSDVIVTLAKVLCGPIPSDRQVEILTSLAGPRPAKDSASGRLFRSLVACLAETNEFFSDVLPKLDLPTQDGNWHASYDVARSETGVARRHRVISEFRPILRLNSDDPVVQVSGVEGNSVGNGLDTLEKYFEPWHGRAPHGAVGAFLSLLGTGPRNSIGNLAQQWLGEDVAKRLPGELDSQSVNVFILPDVARGENVRAMNVLGARVLMQAEVDSDTLFADDPVKRPRSQFSLLLREFGNGFWEISLRDVDPQNRSSSELSRLLGSTVERWGSRYLELPREQVNDWWTRWGEGSQADFDPVLASIKANLPLTLQQLDVKESESLRDALRKAERAQRKREQAPSEEALKSETAALNRLAALIEEPQHREFLWKRVNKLMRRYGYGKESVLLELAQNADDALAEAAEIEGGPLPTAVRRLLIRIHEHDGTPTIDVMHWGRSINDSGGAAFPAGRERQWDQDLYFMMVMNLSGKPGEAPGDSASISTTGRFGLGFKSVHLVSSSPSVVSGFIAFSIAGGLVPKEGTVPAEPQLPVIEGRRPTRVRLPLRPMVELRMLIERRFGYARVFLPVFARQVREVVVEGGPFPGAHCFDGRPIDGAPGWSVGVETELPNHVGRWRILRFRPADAGQEDMGTAALAIGLQDGVATNFDPHVPFLWNVTPTSENWGCGYVVNGPFKLDPGRTHVSLDDDSTLRTVGRLGEALGKGLIELHNAIIDSTDASPGALVINDGRGFLYSLWNVLVNGLHNPDALRRKFLSELHGNGRGLAAWSGTCSAVPTGLPAPFRSMLPPLASNVHIEIAGGDFDSHVCAALADIEDENLIALVRDRRIVSARIEQLIRPLCNFASADGNYIAPTPLRPSDLFRELADSWDHCLTPERLHALRPINGGGARSFDAYDPQGVTWRQALKARASDGSLQPLRNLLLRDAPELLGHIDADARDELRRAAFAPDNRVLDPAYIECREDWQVFQWLRDQHRVDTAMMAEWYADLSDIKRPVAISYLLVGVLGSSLLQRLVPRDQRPHWLREYDEVRRLVEGQCNESWRRQSLLGALFPGKFRAQDWQPDPITPESGTFFQELLEWWDDDADRSRVIAAYEGGAWPDWLRRGGIAKGLRTDSEDHWLALLILGACRSLGGASDHHHRSFLELMHSKGWWEVFKTPDDDNAWMEMLRDWQDDALARLTYPRWMSLFSAICQLSRYQDVYRRLLKSAGRRPEGMYQVSCLLAPRVDVALTGAGTHFDAPPAPLNMGIHWVLRELVRLEVIEGEQLFPGCWVPSKQVIRLLVRLGLEQPDDRMSNSAKARAIFDFLASELGTRAPNLHRAFDIPLRHAASDADLRHKFGLED